MQVEPVKPKLKPPGAKRLKLKCDVLRLCSAFGFSLRRYTKEGVVDAAGETKAFKKVACSIVETFGVGRCRLTLRKAS